MKRKNQIVAIAIVAFIVVAFLLGLKWQYLRTEPYEVLRYMLNH